MLNIEELSYGVFGNCVKLDNGVVQIVASLEFGPRILSYSLNGKENMLYNDIEKTPLHKPLDVYGNDCIILYGGHRVWISPEILPRCYHPDNVPCTYKKTENGIDLIGAVEDKTQIQKIIRVSVHPGKAAVSICNEIINHSLWDIELAPWSITMMASGGYSIIPMSKRDTGFLPNRCISFWDYSDLSDSRVRFNKEYITLTQNKDIAEAFKLGLPNEDGWAAYVNRSQVFIKFFEHDSEGLYPDNNSSYESYVNGKMLEMEILGEMCVLESGASVTLEENWELMPHNGESEAALWNKLSGRFASAAVR